MYEKCGIFLMKMLTGYERILCWYKKNWDTFKNEIIPMNLNQIISPSPKKYLDRMLASRYKDKQKNNLEVQLNLE